MSGADVLHDPLRADPAPDAALRPCTPVFERWLRPERDAEGLAEFGAYGESLLGGLRVTTSDQDTPGATIRVEAVIEC